MDSTLFTIVLALAWSAGGVAESLVLEAGAQSSTPDAGVQSSVPEAGAIFSAQVARLLDRIRMPPEQMAEAPRVLADLEKALATRWPGNRVVLFGSLVTGLAMVGSDFDVYVILPNRSIPSTGPIVEEAKEVLENFPDYVNLVVDPFYLTCKYVPLDMKIDLLFNNPEGGKNSALMRYLLHVDERILELALVVKHWARVHGITGKGRLPPYGMTTLLLFYLQQVDMLPPITALQRDAPISYYAHWNFGFNEMHYRPKNNASVYQLLGGFFEYYNNFDFENLVISMYLGYPVQRKMFENMLKYSKEFFLYTLNSVLKLEEPFDLSCAACVQDVFLHDKNLAESLDLGESAPFRHQFRHAADQYGADHEKSFLRNILKVRHQLIPFGSLMNGLGMRGSDFDYTALLPTAHAPSNRTILKPAIRVFQRFPDLFSEYYTFTGSIEFVSFLHNPTGNIIDVIFNDFDGIKNTELVKYLVDLDERVFEMAMIVKYWAKVQEITAERVLSSFATTLLVVFYLQQRGILPSLANMQRSAEPRCLAGWNTVLPEFQLKTRIDEPLYNLVGGFFEYYDAFDFENNLISTFTGRPERRQAFEDLRNVPGEFDLYKQRVGDGETRPLILHNTTIIIQHPFVHNDNLAKRLTTQLTAVFRDHLHFAARKFKEKNEMMFLCDIMTKP